MPRVLVRTASKPIAARVGGTGSRLDLPGLPKGPGDGTGTAGVGYRRDFGFARFAVAGFPTFALADDILNGVFRTGMPLTPWESNHALTFAAPLATETYSSLSSSISSQYGRRLVCGKK